MFVAGQWGEGMVMQFQRALVGASPHLVRFDGGGDPQVEWLKLRRKGALPIPPNPARPRRRS